MVKISNCGICHSDLSMLDLGGAGQLPVILGHEAAGTIESIGSDVTSVKPGDKVLVTPLAFCGQCYWCARAEPTACVEAQSFTSGLRPDGTSPFFNSRSVCSLWFGRCRFLRKDNCPRIRSRCLMMTLRLILPVL